MILFKRLSMTVSDSTTHPHLLYYVDVSFFLKERLKASSMGVGGRY